MGTAMLRTMTVISVLSLAVSASRCIKCKKYTSDNELTTWPNEDSEDRVHKRVPCPACNVHPDGHASESESSDWACRSGGSCGHTRYMYETHACGGMLVPD